MTSAAIIYPPSDLSVEEDRVHCTMCCREEREVQNLVGEGISSPYLVLVPSKDKILLSLEAK